MCPHIDRYGFSSHDGVGYAVQPIEDRQNQVVLTTSFLKGGGADDGDNVEGSWAVRVSASPLGGEDGNGAPSQELSLFFYFGIEDEYAPPHTEQESYLGEGASADRGGGEYYTLEGRVAGLGKFSVLASGRGANGERLPLTGWTPPAEAGGRAGGGAGGGTSTCAHSSSTRFAVATQPRLVATQPRLMATQLRLAVHLVSSAAPRLARVCW